MKFKFEGNKMEVIIEFIVFKLGDKVLSIQPLTNPDVYVSFSIDTLKIDEGTISKLKIWRFTEWNVLGGIFTIRGTAKELIGTKKGALSISSIVKSIDVEV